MCAQCVCLFWEGAMFDTKFIYVNMMWLVVGCFSLIMKRTRLRITWERVLQDPTIIMDDKTSSQRKYAVYVHVKLISATTTNWFTDKVHGRISQQKSFLNQVFSWILTQPTRALI